MTQLPPTLSHELEGYEDWNPEATGTTDELAGDCSVELGTGEECGRERPCQYHD